MEFQIIVATLSGVLGGGMAVLRDRSARKNIRKDAGAFAECKPGRGSDSATP